VLNSGTKVEESPFFPREMGSITPCTPVTLDKEPSEISWNNSSSNKIANLCGRQKIEGDGFGTSSLRQSEFRLQVQRTHPQSRAFA
jgi:hypothetical protein